MAAQLEQWSELNDKVVMVTGASSGIGKEFCLDLAKAGCKIVAAARRIDRLKSLCDEINRLGAHSDGSTTLSELRSVPLELDVSSDGASIESAVKKAWDAFGRIDVLINNAGIRAREVWEQTFPIIEGWPIHTVDSVLHWALTSLDREGLCYFSLLCWFLWKGRCSKVFEGKTHTAMQVITSAGGLAAKILSLDESHSSHPSHAIRHTSTWHPPAPNSLSVNVDASFGEDGMRACGAIVRDHLGCVIQATSTLLPTGADVLHGELLAILRGLELAHVHGYTKVEIWSDSLSAIRLLEPNEDHLHPLAALVHKCLACQSEFTSCLFYFTRRENNYPAHLLARWSVLHSTPMFWGPNPPPYVLDAALADLL